ncbi:2543_t:CDS:2, partial [Gigaspora rosea]
ISTSNILLRRRCMDQRDAYSSGSLRSEKEKTMGVGYISHYSDSSITENLEILRDWPSDDDIKGAINHAYEQATALAKDVLGMIKKEDCFTDGCSQLTFILGSTRRSQNCNIEENASIGITNEKLEISVLVNQRHSHEAYTNQRMERKVAALSASGSNYRFNSSLVSFLSSNECARPGIPRQNRWKMRARLKRLNDGIKSSLSKLIFIVLNN